jgi:transposase InsO family protein
VWLYFRFKLSHRHVRTIHRDLTTLGVKEGVNWVARLMRENNIQLRMAQQFVITTDAKNTMAPATDHLQRNLRTAVPKQAWVSDTTFIRTRQGWLYLAVMSDLLSRSVIGWSMGKTTMSSCFRMH